MRFKSHPRNQKDKVAHRATLSFCLWSVNFELPNDRRRRSWGSEPKRRRWRMKRGERVRKQGVLRRMEQDDYVFEWAMKNPIPATMLCIQFGCQPKKPRCRKVSGLFYTHFLQCNFGRCKTSKTPCGWDLNLNNRLFRGVCVIFLSHKLPFFHLFQKNICKLFMSKTQLFQR